MANILHIKWYKNARFRGYSTTGARGIVFLDVRVIWDFPWSHNDEIFQTLFMQICNYKGNYTYISNDPFWLPNWPVLPSILTRFDIPDDPHWHPVWPALPSSLTRFAIHFDLFCLFILTRLPRGTVYIYISQNQKNVTIRLKLKKTLIQHFLNDLHTVIRGNFVFPGQLRSPEWTFRKKTKLLTAFHTDYRTFHQVHHFEDKSFNFKISWNSTFSDKNCGRYDIKREDFFLKKKLKKKHDFSTSINKPSTAQTT